MFRRWVLSLEKTKNPNFYLMNGGKFTIPKQQKDEFYKRYIDAYNSEEELYVLEKIGSKFKFPKVTVTGTSNLIMASIFVKGVHYIKNILYTIILKIIGITIQD